jgi:hypothetical protein
MSRRSTLQLGFEMQRISESLTWKEYTSHHPLTKVGFCHHDGRVLFTLIDHALGHDGVVKYADNAHELLEIAHLALWEEGYIEVL